MDQLGCAHRSMMPVGDRAHGWQAPCLRCGMVLDWFYTPGTPGVIEYSIPASKEDGEGPIEEPTE